MKEIIAEAEGQQYYVLSIEPIEDIKPEVPTNYLAQIGFIENKTPRYYVGKDISKLVAMTPGLSPDIVGDGGCLYVYAIDEFLSSEVTDTLTKEVGLNWGLSPEPVTLAGVIKICGLKDIIQLTLSNDYGNSLDLKGTIKINYPVVDFEWTQIPHLKI